VQAEDFGCPLFDVVLNDEHFALNVSRFKMDL
jgi:hypothetical protein